jgi:uncharacterized protein YjiK
MKSQAFNSIKKGFNRHFNIFRLSLFLSVIIFVAFCTSATSKKESEKQQKSQSTKADSSLYSGSDRNTFSKANPENDNTSFPYDLDNPDERYPLPKYLTEISGLAYYEEDKILCIQDEKAEIYVFSLDKKEIVNKYVFGKHGDFEDVAVIGQTAFVLQSDGRIFEITNFEKEERKVIEHKTSLSKKNNCEGLMYDKYSNSLFIACKGSPDVEKDKGYKGYKAIYKFDLGKMKLNKKPEILVSLNKPDSYKDINLPSGPSLNDKKSRLTKYEIGFQPSGLAIHPVYDEIYLIASVGKILIILDRKGKVLEWRGLDPLIFDQPEGICFSPSGDLFISNEGKGGKGYILKFNLRK